MTTRRSSNMDEWLENLDFINAYPNEMRNNSIGQTADIEQYLDRRGEFDSELSEEDLFYDVENQYSLRGDSSVPNTPRYASGRSAGRSAKKNRPSSKRTPLQDVNQDDIAIESVEEAEGLSESRAAKGKTPKSERKARRFSSPKGSVVARRSARLMQKTAEKARSASEQRSQHREQGSSRAKSAGPKSILRFGKKTRKTAPAVRIVMAPEMEDEEIDDIPVEQVPGPAVFSAERHTPEDRAALVEARERRSRSVESTSTFDIEAEDVSPEVPSPIPDDPVEDESDEEMVEEDEEQEEVFERRATRGEARRRSASVPNIARASRGVHFDDHVDGDAETRRGRSAARRRDISHLPPISPASSTRSLTRPEPFHFQIEDRLAARKRKQSAHDRDEPKKRKIALPKICRGEVFSMTFFDRQQLAKIKQEQLRQKADEEMKAARVFHAHANPASHNSRSMTMMSTTLKSVMRSRRVAQQDTTQAEPFHFKAQPVPQSVLRGPKPRPVTHKPTTEVRPFKLPGDERMKKRRSYDRRLRERMEAEEREREARRREEEEQADREYEEARRKTNFKANPVPAWLNRPPAATITAPAFSDDEDD